MTGELAGRCQPEGQNQCAMNVFRPGVDALGGTLSLLIQFPYWLNNAVLRIAILYQGANCRAGFG